MIRVVLPEIADGRRWDECAGRPGMPDIDLTERRIGVDPADTAESTWGRLLGVAYASLRHRRRWSRDPIARASAHAAEWWRAGVLIRCAADRGGRALAAYRDAELMRAPVSVTGADAARAALRDIVASGRTMILAIPVMVSGTVIGAARVRAWARAVAAVADMAGRPDIGVRCERILLSVTSAAAGVYVTAARARSTPRSAEHVARAVERALRDWPTVDELQETGQGDPAPPIPDVGVREAGGAITWAPMLVRDAVADRPTEASVTPEACERVTRASALAGSPAWAYRAYTGGPPFRRRRPRRAGAVLIDVSGSMGWEVDRLIELSRRVPTATVAVYSGLHPDREGRGVLSIIARDGRVLTPDAMRAELQAYHGHGNTIDGPALRWLAGQAGPRVWVSDGHVTGQCDRESRDLVAECGAICAAAQIRRVDTRAPRVVHAALVGTASTAEREVRDD